MESEGELCPPSDSTFWGNVWILFYILLGWTGSTRFFGYFLPGIPPSGGLSRNNFIRKIFLGKKHPVNPVKFISLKMESIHYYYRDIL
jgi:hypothetical protein